MPETVQLLVFQLANRSYGLHLDRVERVVRSVDVTPLPQAPAVVAGAISVAGEIAPVFDIRKRFGLPAREVSVQDQFIIARAAGRMVALVVEAVLDIAERPAEEIKGAGDLLPQLHQIEGVIQLEDKLILIHDLDRFLSREEGVALDRALLERSADGN